MSVTKGAPHEALQSVASWFRASASLSGSAEPFEKPAEKSLYKELTDADEQVLGDPTAYTFNHPGPQMSSAP